VSVTLLILTSAITGCSLIAVVNHVDAKNVRRGGLRESGFIMGNGCVAPVVLILASARRKTANLGFLIELEHAVVLLVADWSRVIAAHCLLLLLLGHKVCLGRTQVGQVHLGGKLFWVAGQYHPIEESDAIAGGNRKRRR